ncbi:MAG: DNA double-strand break repair nuclease NurA [Candidatus Methanosuratus sp.]|nr:DNA double-strand break repair nuclease NurA [Candidatus Methanosuratincola sp.]
MHDPLDEICEALRRHLELPAGGIVSGFSQPIGEDSLQGLHLSGAEEIPVISAVDGGSNTLLRTPTLVVVLNRVYYNQFLGMRKMDHYETVEFISKTEIIERDKRNFFRTEVFPLEGPCLLSPIEIDLKDETLMVGTTYGDMSRALSMARRFCEWRLAERAVEAGAECILMDGALQTAFKDEHKVANKLYDKAKGSGSIVAGLSKSTTIYLANGFPLAGTVDEMARRKGYPRWIIKLGESEEWTHRATVYYAKLHEMADSGYRLDVFEGAKEEEVEGLLRGLLACSTYFGYPGYPYPLIDAHTYAKVGQAEADGFRAQILDRLGWDECRKLELMERALMQHGVLDSLGG